MIDFRCANCDSQLQAPDSAAGKKAKCNECHQVVMVPAPPAPPPKPTPPPPVPKPAPANAAPPPSPVKAATPPAAAPKRESKEAESPAESFFIDPRQWVAMFIAILIAYGALMGPRYEYNIVSPPDDGLRSKLDELGAGGWEIVSARRALNGEYTPASYELIVKRRTWLKWP
jgi:hypothetical protein